MGTSGDFAQGGKQAFSNKVQQYLKEVNVKVLLTESNKKWIYIPTKIPMRNCLLFASFCNSNIIIEVRAVVIQMPGRVCFVGRSQSTCSVRCISLSMGR